MFPITVSFTFNNMAEFTAVNEALAALGLSAGNVKPDPRKAQQTSAAETQKAPEVKAEQPTPAADAVDRKTCSAAVVKLATKDKAKAMAILAEFKVAKASELPDNQLAACHTKVTEALAALGA